MLLSNNYFRFILKNMNDSEFHTFAFKNEFENMSGSNGILMSEKHLTKIPPKQLTLATPNGFQMIICYLFRNRITFIFSICD